MIMGNLLVNSIPTKVLFDSGASHSFISRPFVAKHDLVTEDTPKPWKIISPGMQMTFRVFFPNASVKMGNYSFMASPIRLSYSDIGLILRMDFLTKNKALSIVKPKK